MMRDDHPFRSTHGRPAEIEDALDAIERGNAAVLDLLRQLLQRLDRIESELGFASENVDGE